MIIICEGPRNVGKTSLIEKSKFDNYKFPFISYYKQMLAVSPDDTGAGSKEAFHFSTAFDVSLLSLANAHAIGQLGPLLIDRGFLSNVVLGELQSRITHQEGLKYIDFLATNGYLKSIKVIYIDKEVSSDGRTTEKDDWDFLGYEEQKLKFEQYFAYLKTKYDWEPKRFINKMTPLDYARFTAVVFDMQILRTKNAINELFKFK
jgi:hypothetical protein